MTQTAKRILFKFTTRSRQEFAFRGLDSIVNNLSDTENYQIIVSMDVDDPVMCNKDVLEHLNTFKNLTAYYGISHSKISAINRDIFLAEPFDILINFSDDQVFTVKGFDDIIRDAFEKHGLDTFMHFHDGNQNRLATMSIIGRTWFERTNYIYHPSYITEWCDNEEQEKAIMLGKYVYMGDDVVIMKHWHPYHTWGQVKVDALYEKNFKMSKVDQENFELRKLKNFDL